MTDSYHFNPNFDHIAYMERQERDRLNQLFDSYYARQAKVLNQLAGIAGDVAQQSVGPFPSGATLKVAGDKIVGRVGVIVTVAEWPTWPDSEPNRAPLPHFNQRTEFDAFPDFVVFHEFEPVAPLHTSPTTDSAYPAIAGLLRG